VEDSEQRPGREITLFLAAPPQTSGDNRQCRKIRKRWLGPGKRASDNWHSFGYRKNNLSANRGPDQGIIRCRCGKTILTKWGGAPGGGPGRGAWKCGPLLEAGIPRPPRSAGGASDIGPLAPRGPIWPRKDRGVGRRIRTPQGALGPARRSSWGRKIRPRSRDGPRNDRPGKGGQGDVRW